MSNLEPDAIPDPNPGVRRINKIPLLIVVGIVLSFTFMVYVMLTEKAQRQDAKKVEKQVQEMRSASRAAESIINDYKERKKRFEKLSLPESEAEKQLGGEPAGAGKPYLMTPYIYDKISNPQPAAVVKRLKLPTLAELQAGAWKKVKQPTAEEGQFMHAVRTFNDAPMPPGNQPVSQQKLPPKPKELHGMDAETYKKLKKNILKKRLKNFELAMISDTTIKRNAWDQQVDMAKKRPAVENDETGYMGQIRSQNAMNPNDAFMAKLHAQKQGSPTGVGGAHGASGGEHGFKPDSQGKLVASTQGDRWALNQTMQAPRTPYEVRAGAVLPGVMISGINSSLPGMVRGQISADVFDTATGRHLLIPQGSQLVGSYGSGVAWGQERVMIAWNRIVFPDGKALDIGAMSGADSIGQSGFEDQVNHHYLRTFGSAILMSVIIGGIELSQDTEGDEEEDIFIEALGQQLGSAAAKMIEKNLNIAPTIEIRPGYRFNVMVSKDLTFANPYRPFDY